MKVNVVTVNSGWILQKIAERIVSAGCKLGYNFILSHDPTNDADCNFYVDVQNCYHRKSKTLDIGYYTHMDKDDIKTVNRNCLSLDYIVHVCSRYYERFKPIYNVEKMSVLFPAEVNTIFEQYKPKIGIFQRGFYEGKGFNFMHRMTNYPILKKFKFKFVGKDWHAVVVALQNQNIDVENITDENYLDYPKHIHDVDYVLIPSLWEGGPMSIYEGLACGKPIISSDVGIVGDFNVDYIFKPNDENGLIQILNQILEPIEKRRSSTAELTYENYVKSLIEIINKLKNEKA